MNYTKPTETSQTKNQPRSKVSLRSQFYKIKLACGTTYQLQDIEAAGISYVPCSYKTPIPKFAHLWDSSLQVNLDSYDDNDNRWKLSGMKGIQIMTGKPTKRMNGETPQYLVVLDQESRLALEHPDIAEEVERIYLSSCDGSPCIIESKSGGLHLYAYCEYLDKKRSFKNSDDKMLLELLSEKCLSRVDDRYRIKHGSLLNIPSIDKSALEEISQILSTIAPKGIEDLRLDFDSEGKSQYLPPLQCLSGITHTGDQTRKTKGKAANTSSRTVEKVEIKDLRLKFDKKGKSQYLPLSQCLSEVTHTGDQTRKSVRYTQGAGELIGFCHNCEHEWRIPQSDVPQPPPPDTHQPPAYRHFTKELRTVATQVLGIFSTNGWQPPA